jgi:excinuclease ABC subunit A
MALTMFDRARWTGKAREAEIFKEWLMHRLNEAVIDEAAEDIDADEAELAAGASEVSKGADAKVGDQSYTVLNLVKEDRDWKVLVDPKTHLVKQVEVDLKRELERRGAPAVKAATLTIDTVEQFFVETKPAEKTELLARVLEAERPDQAIVFVRTKIRCEQLYRTLRDRGMNVKALHGDMSQGARDGVMISFKDERVKILVATDVAARGLDISTVTHIVNFDIPTSPDVYVHRIGRTGRVGRSGRAITFIERRHRETESDWSKERYEAFMREVPCPVCDGARLKPEVLAVKVGGRSIADVCRLPIADAAEFLKGLELGERERQIAAEVLKEIHARLGFLLDVGLHYLTLERPAGTLSGGEAQRIRLATQIGSGLVGVLYVLDEPSIGLHQRDNRRLIETLTRLRDLGNTLIVVEHDEDTIRTADWIVDVGPGAGEHGGRIVHSGDLAGLLESPESVTGAYLSGQRELPVPAVRRPVDPVRQLTVVGARENNLRDIDVSFPLGVLTAVTGVSGSGKSTLVNSILHTVLANELNGARQVAGRHTRVTGLDHLDKVVHVDQGPIGRTPRSNPATYTGVWDRVRKLFAETTEAKVRGYGPGRFSFNVKGGRCEACTGDGTIKIEMNFLPDVYVPCEVCHGSRYNRETLEVHFKGKTVADVLDMPIEEAAGFFEAFPAISRYMKTLVDVGLGYVRLGQPAPTLSGGEAQRVKLATELQKRSTGRTIYVLDEPTTGLHFEDIRKLLGVLQSLVDKGNSVIVIEHNLDVIKNADWVVDMGPEGGSGGGTVVAEGTPEAVSRVPESHTGTFLAEVLDGSVPVGPPADGKAASAPAARAPKARVRRRKAAVAG